VQALLRHTRCLFAACILGSLVPGFAQAADHFLTIGGGDSPAKNQASLEKNVLYLRRILADLKVPAERHDVLFADGNDEGRDLQFHDEKAELPRVNVLLAELFPQRTGGWIGLQYRSHALGHVRGPSTRKVVEEWFEQVGPKLSAADDRLIIYFTGHGGVGAEPAPRNTTMALWENQELKVTDLTALLDKLPPELPVVLIMVQCHSGGFADVIFKDAQFGNKLDGLSGANRCGFFATVPEREAAGCTSDIDEENYREYSTYFWAALYGKTRTGEEVKPTPDYDGDGRVSFAEAHAYVQITSDTIDIPVSTSDNFLRAFSITGSDRPQRFAGRPGMRRGATRPAAPVPPPAPTSRPAGLLTPELNFAQLLERATPAQRAVIEGLSNPLELWGNDRMRSARALADRLSRERQELERQKGKLRSDANGLRNQIRAAVSKRWPELSTAWHPEVQRILREEADVVVKAIEGHPSYAKWDESTRIADELDEKSRTLERKWVKCQRFIRAVEDVALAENLPKIVPPEVVERYGKLLAAESETLAQIDPTHPQRR
jgi:hypothetical protein